MSQDIPIPTTGLSCYLWLNVSPSFPAELITVLRAQIRTPTIHSIQTKKQSLWEVKSSVRQSTMDIWIFVWLLISCCRLSVTGRLAITDSTQSGTIFKSGESFELQCTSNIPWFLCIWDTPGILRSGILITLHCRSDLYFLYSGNEWKSSKADVLLRCKLLAQHKEIQRDEGEGLVVNCK